MLVFFSYDYGTMPEIQINKDHAYHYLTSYINILMNVNTVILIDYLILHNYTIFVYNAYKLTWQSQVVIICICKD